MRYSISGEQKLEISFTLEAVHQLFMNRQTSSPLDLPEAAFIRSCRCMEKPLSSMYIVIQSRFTLWYELLHESPPSYSQVTGHLPIVCQSVFSSSQSHQDAGSSTVSTPSVVAHDTKEWGMNKGTAESELKSDSKSKSRLVTVNLM
jgi:hypothetical protein